ncbi:hypothetical protein H7J07_05730 [Mycobacterium koreense]|uniref:Uncharacterized protein n=1 Tax=Mycolicibacillus koreensis TaxID=1069220 RepID=A0A7I7SC93_9MYCO|nr:hypothetical protein [Mycolicibacillus koreensis]MCV7247725.1 hypothetical protein [Mycolicibacillus koreensis]OSC34746.1 hypothetical protein B8W67_05715 [Mycolicibacillus koreensis]BBY54110.1 hypothetical protein MKOR_13610 [Mycolicibacillus koreensis]
MAEIRRYVTVDADDNESDWEYDSFDDAKAAAIRQGNAAVSCNIYEYSDRELAWTPDGSGTWPPQ